MRVLIIGILACALIACAETTNGGMQPDMPRDEPVYEPPMDEPFYEPPMDEPMDESPEPTRPSDSPDEAEQMVLPMATDAEYAYGDKEFANALSLDDIRCTSEGNGTVEFTFTNTGQNRWHVGHTPPFNLGTDTVRAAFFLNEYSMNDDASRRSGVRLFGDFLDACNLDTEYVAPGETVTCTVAPVYLRGDDGLDRPNEIVLELPGTTMDDKVYFNCPGPGSLIDPLL